MTVDQIMGLLRQVLPIVGTMLTVFGVSASTATATVNLIMEIAGPVMIAGGAVWAFIANSRKSIMASAAKPVEAGVPAPKIVLPPQEAALADALPGNVTAH